MKRKLLLLFFGFLLFFSCRKHINPYPNGKPLDVQKLVEMKFKWKILNIKNYSFTYEFDTYRPSYCIGYVTVKDGVGKVTFNTEYGRFNPDKGDQYKKLYYIASIEDVFDNILDEYLRLKKKKDEGKNNYLDYYAGYDKKYFFLDYAVCDTFGPTLRKELVGLRSHYFRIKDFKVLE